MRCGEWRIGDGKDRTKWSGALAGGWPTLQVEGRKCGRQQKDLHKGQIELTGGGSGWFYSEQASMTPFDQAILLAQHDGIRPWNLSGTKPCLPAGGPCVPPATVTVKVGTTNVCSSSHQGARDCIPGSPTGLATAKLASGEAGIVESWLSHPSRL